MSGGRKRLPAVSARDKVLMAKAVRQGMIPKQSVADLLYACDMAYAFGEGGCSPAELFKRFLRLMKKYRDYFFHEAWPLEYDFDKSTTITAEDDRFLIADVDDFDDRRLTVAIRKIICVHGSTGAFGIKWVQDAIDKKYIWPLYEQLLACLDGLVKEDFDAHRVLDSLKKSFSVIAIHESLLHRIEHNYPYEAERKLVEDLLELIHCKEGFPDCYDSRCFWRNKKTIEEYADP